MIACGDASERVENDLRLPGVGDGTVVRAPSTRRRRWAINFHEVRARSAPSTTCRAARYGFSWTINPFGGCTHACHSALRRRTHTYLDFDAGRDFEREIVVKVNVPELLRAELARPSWKRELVALGTNTDPYQWVESRYRMMPRDPRGAGGGGDAGLGADQVAAGAARRRRSSSGWRRTAAGLGQPLGADPRRGAWRATEPHTPSPAARPSTPVAELRRRGIDSGVLIAPLMPGINDTPSRSSRSSTAPARPAPPSSAASPSTSAARSRTSSSPGWKPNAPTSSPIRAALPRTRLHAPRAAQARHPSSARLGQQLV